MTEYIGLYGKKVKNPVYYCRSHNIYLTEEDVKLKKCLCKPTADMISTQRCKWLEDMVSHDEENQLRRDANRSYRHSSKKAPVAPHKTTYRKTVEKLLKERNNNG